jgi:hypothetical protein
MAVFSLPGVREPFFGSFAIHRRLRAVKGHYDVFTVLTDRERRQLVVSDFPDIDLRFVYRAWRIVRPSGEPIALERFERFRVPAAHVAPVRFFLLPHLSFSRSLLCLHKRTECDRY